VKDLTLDDLKRPLPRRVEKVPLPELGGNAYLRSLRARELEEWEQSRAAANGPDAASNAEGVRLSLLALTLVDAAGTPLSPSEADLKALGEQDALPINLLAEKACAMNGLRQSDVEALARKNSARTRADSSGGG